MPALNEVARGYTDLSEGDLAFLHELVADWQIIADLSFADLVLWLPDRQRQGYWGGAQMRPTTGPTALLDDLVGAFVPRGRRPLLDAAFDEQRIAREGDPEWRDDVPIRVETIPVLRAGKLLAVVARNTNLLGVRTPSRLELAYLETAGDLTRMISVGRFPGQGDRGGDSAVSPRVGDGFVRTDADGVVSFASPNAQSAFRRLGFARDLVGEPFAATAEAATTPSSRPLDEALSVTLSGSRPRQVELRSRDATVVVRVIPLRPADVFVGAAVLLRDVTELRDRERELLTKDATIREIHHRVKNNLQTVAALLRLQARRLEAPEARQALDEAVRRVGSIALVHETLSQTPNERVDFDEVTDRLITMVVEVSARPEQLTWSRRGSFGQLSAEVATPLAMVMTEVLQNAVEHGIADGSGQLAVAATRRPGWLHVTVDDDGVGLPSGFSPIESANLGLSIVRTLVESELGGSIVLSGRPTGGTRVTLELPNSAR